MDIPMLAVWIIIIAIILVIMFGFIFPNIVKEIANFLGVLF